MLKKLSIIICLVGFIGTAQAASVRDMQTLTGFCATAYADFRKTGNPKMLQDMLKSMKPEGGGNALALTCYAYAQGFMHGEKVRENRLRIT